MGYNAFLRDERKRVIREGERECVLGESRTTRVKKKKRWQMRRKRVTEGKSFGPIEAWAASFASGLFDQTLGSPSTECDINACAAADTHTHTSRNSGLGL
ncbi:hypothetical protein ACJQWK_09595 [Exserohilum turcicum]